MGSDDRAGEDQRHGEEQGGDGNGQGARRPRGRAASAMTAADQRSQMLVERFARSGYRRIDTPILSPSAVFLDFSGEAIRSQLFLTSDGAGQELCLRPEFTIPVCRAFLDGPRREASFCYAGPVFRSEGKGSGQVVQSGVESFGRPDTAAADAEILALTLEAAAEAGFQDPQVRMGDAGLLARLFEVLDLPASWRRRLKRGLAKGQPLQAILDDTPARGADHSGVIAALTGTDEQGARALVEDLLAIAGIATVGGRTASEIAERFLAQVASRAAPAFGAEKRQILQAFLAITGDPDEASAALRRLAEQTRCDLGQALDLFDERANFLAAHGLGQATLTFDAAFGRDLDYYTGFTFEARHGGGFSAARTSRTDEVVIGGGRYDGLAQALGSAEPVPAVGASIFVERIAPPEASADA